MRRTLEERAAEIGHKGEVYRWHRGGRDAWGHKLPDLYHNRCSCGYEYKSNVSKREATVDLNGHYRDVLS